MSDKRPSRLPYVIALMAVATVLVFAWAGRDNFTPVIAGYAAPGFEAATLDGEPLTLDSYRGKVVLLNIWATWCAPCREEMPSMQSLYERIDHPDFEIVAISVDAAVKGQAGWGSRIGGDVEGFTNELGLTFPILWDPSGETADSYTVNALPESFLIGKDGMIYKRLAGATEWDSDAYVEQIRRLLGS